MDYILIADDNQDITDILSVYVENEGYQPVVASDGEEALKNLKNMHQWLFC